MSKWTVDDLRAIYADLAGPETPEGQKERKQRRILETATRLFVEQGYRKTSVDEIARDAHVAKGTVYLYFPSKAHLLVGAIAHEERQYIALIAPLLDESRPARERLKELVRLTLVLAEKMPLVSRLMGGDQELAIALAEVEDFAPDLMEKNEAMRRHFFGPLLNEAHGGTWSEEEADERVRVFLGLLLFSPALHSAEARQGLPVERFAELLAEMLIDGIAVPGRKRAAKKKRAATSRREP